MLRFVPLFLHLNFQLLKKKKNDVYLFSENSWKLTSTTAETAVQCGIFEIIGNDHILILALACNLMEVNIFKADNKWPNYVK